ncbi:MAG: helix-turn-helix domain-containing protein [Paludibacteraceae bacterium]|nr:helix-turn-helix domain-containing protein [Paludibacteraceae bacterium]
MIEIFLTPDKVAKDLALRAKQRRVAMRLTQDEMSQKADMPVSTYRRFEQTGQISLQGLLKVAFALDALDDFNNVFEKRTWSSIDEMLEEKQHKQRVRHE